MRFFLHNWKKLQNCYWMIFQDQVITQYLTFESIYRSIRSKMINNIKIFISYRLRVETGCGLIFISYVIWLQSTKPSSIYINLVLLSLVSPDFIMKPFIVKLRLHTPIVVVIEVLILCKYWPHILTATIVTI